MFFWVFGSSEKIPYKSQKFCLYSLYGRGQNTAGPIPNKCSVRLIEQMFGGMGRGVGSTPVLTSPHYEHYSRLPDSVPLFAALSCL